MDLPPPVEPSPPAPVGLTGRRALLILLSYFAVQLLAAAVVMAAAAISLTPAIADVRQLTARVRSVSLLPSAVLGIVLGALVVIRMTRRSFPGLPTAEALRAVGASRAPGRDVGWCAFLGFALAVLYALVLSRLPIQPSRPWGPLMEAVSTPGWQRDVWAILAICLAPPIEELLFRGVLFHGLANSWGTAASATTVTVLFSLFHLPEVIPYWPAIIAITVMAAVAMTVRIRTRSLGPAVALHAAYNGGLMLCLYAGIG